MNPADENRSIPRSGGRLSVGRRRAMLRRLAEVLDRNADRLFQAVAADLGRREREFLDDELGPLKANIRGLIRRLPGFAPGLFLLDLPGERLMPTPYGRVLIYGHWAEPVRSALEPLAAALAAGNRVELRPALKAPVSAQLLAELVAEALPEQEARIAERGIPDRELAGGAFDLIVCTGDPAEAEELLRAAPRLTPILRTPTGKNPVIVDMSAGIRRAARRIVRAKFRNAGQSPDAPDYVLAHARIRQKLVYEMSREVRALFGRDPELAEEPLRVLNSERFEALRKLLDRGRLVCGGEVDRAKRYIAPTILDGIAADDPIMRETVAGPILPVLEFGTLSEAAEIVSHLPPAPMCCCFSARRAARRLLTSVRCGSVVLNDCVPRARFRYCGGRNVYGAREALSAFSRMKPIGFHARFFPGAEIAAWLERRIRGSRG